MKYKVGDRVRVKKDLKVSSIYGGLQFLEDMSRYAGKEERVEETRTGDGFKLTNSPYIFKAEMLEPVYTQSIHITADGTTTHAILKDGKDVVKRTKAELHPNDTFDFETGAKVAFERLWEGEVREVKRPAKAGEYIKIVDPYGTDGVYKKGDILKVKQVTAGGWVQRAYERARKSIDPSEYVVLENYTPPEPAEPELPTFTFEGFKRGDFAVNCRTEEEANIFCAYLHGKGERWRHGDRYIDDNFWERYGENTCYLGRGTTGKIKKLELEGTTIIPFNAADLD